jgi:hypothetical protein
MDHQKALNAVVLLYLAISTNFLKELFPCELQYQLATNMWLKHLIGVLVFYFTIVSSSILPNVNPRFQFGWSILLYLLFLTTTRCDYKITLFLLLGTAALLIWKNIYEYDLTNDNNKEDKNKQNDMRIVSQTITWAMMGILVLGVLAFIGYKYIHLNRNGSLQSFNWPAFILGVPECPQNSIMAQNLLNSSNLVTEVTDGFSFLKQSVTKV